MEKPCENKQEDDIFNVICLNLISVTRLVTLVNVAEYVQLCRRFSPLFYCRKLLSESSSAYYCSFSMDNECELSTKKHASKTFGGGRNRHGKP